MLAQDCIHLGQFELCQILLMNDQQYPWVILVPMVNGIREAFELNDNQQALLMQESSFVLKVLSEEFNADKMNQAALGNMVPQLHIHHIVRFKHDAAWPAPVWGKQSPKPYTEEGMKEMLVKLRKVLNKHPDFKSV